MFVVYIIHSAERDKYYIGHTDNVERRLQEHILKRNLGASDWTLKYSEKFESRSAAMKREYEIKAKKKRSYIEWLISSAG